MSIAGWSAGKLSARKLYHSVSTSGPTATAKPMLAEDLDDLVHHPGDRMLGADPAAAPRHGEVDARAPRCRRRSASSASRRCGERRLEPRLELVDRRAVALPLLDRQRRPRVLSARGERAALPAQDGDRPPPRARRRRAPGTAVEARQRARRDRDSRSDHGMRCSRVTVSSNASMGPPAERERPHWATTAGERLARLLVVLGHLGQPAEGVRVAHGEVGEHLPVDLDAGLLEPRHEPAVAQAVDPRRRVDAGDPERAELATSSSAGRGRRTAWRARPSPWPPCTACSGRRERPWRPP